MNEPKQARPVGMTPAILKVLEYFMKDPLEAIYEESADTLAYKKGKFTADALAMVTALTSAHLEEDHALSRLLLLDY